MILIFLFLIGVANSYGQEIPEEFTRGFYENIISNNEMILATDKFVYSPGDNVLVAGWIADYSKGQQISIKLIDEFGIVHSEISVSGRSDGFFEIQKGAPYGIPPGEYIISATYSQTQATISLPVTLEIDTLETFIVIPPDSQFFDNGLTYTPQDVIVEATLPIIWINYDKTFHTVVSGTIGFDNELYSDGKFDSGVFEPGGTFELMLKEEGEYNYFCKLHPWLTGSITVVPLTTIQKSSDPIEPEESSSLLNDAEDLENWTQTFCDGCLGEISLSEDSKQGYSSVEWLVQGTQDATEKNSYLILKFPTTDTSIYSNLKLWIKTQGNVDGDSKIILLDNNDEWRLLLAFNSEQYNEWEEVNISLDKFIRDSENFNPTSVKALLVKLPVGSLMKAKQQQTFLDDLRWIERGVKTSEVIEIPLLIQSNKDVYSVFQKISLSGNVLNKEGDIPVTIQIFDPNFNLITIDQKVPDEQTKKYKLAMLSGKFFEKEGEYRVVAQYGVKNYRTEIFFNVLYPVLNEKNYKGFDIYLSDKYYAVPIPFFEGPFEPKRLTSNDYSAIWNNNSLEKLKKIIDANPLGPLWLVTDFEGFNINFYDGTYFATPTDEKAFSVHLLAIGEFTKIFRGDTLQETENKIIESLKIVNKQPDPQVELIKKDIEPEPEIEQTEQIEGGNNLLLLQILLIIGVLIFAGVYTYKSLKKAPMAKI